MAQDCVVRGSCSVLFCCHVFRCVGGSGKWSHGCACVCCWVWRVCDIVSIMMFGDMYVAPRVVVMVGRRRCVHLAKVGVVLVEEGGD